jgi:hypothetical protein
VDQDTGSGVAESGPNSLTLSALHVDGRLVEISLRRQGTEVQFFVDGNLATTVNRTRLNGWLLRARGSVGGRPLVDLPLTLHVDSIGVWLEIRGRIAPTLVERYTVIRMITLIKLDRS